MTATEEPPSMSEDSRREGYLVPLAPHNTGWRTMGDSQELLEENDLEVLQQSRLDLDGPTVVQHVLPEQKMREERLEVRLELGRARRYDLVV